MFPDNSESLSFYNFCGAQVSDLSRTVRILQSKSSDLLCSFSAESLSLSSSLVVIG